MKKFFSCILATVFIFQAVPVFAEEQPSYIPLRNAVETSGGTVKWDSAKNEIEIGFKGDIYKYSTKTADEYYKNSEKLELSAPLTLNNGTTFINYSDIAYVYETENDPYKETKKKAVLNAYNFILNNNLPGITISFVDAENNYKWIQGFGHADIENKKPVTEKTVFGIASISKLFTTTSVMQMVEQGKMKLDGKIIDYIPEFSVKTHPVYGGDSNKITVEMILTHFSGLSEDIFDGFYTTKAQDKNYLNNLVSNLKNEYLVNNQMQRWNYSNAGISLIGVIISRLNGETKDVYKGFVDYTDKNLFERMGMKMSSFELKEANRQYLAKSYADSKSGAKEELFLNSLPCGSMYSNGEDMSRFMNFILNDGTFEGKTLVSADSVKKMLTPVTWEMPLNPELEIGMVWMSGNYNGVDMVGHGGDIEYFHSDLQLSKDEKLGVFVSSNSSNSVGLSGYISAELLANAYSEKTGFVLKPFVPAQTNDVTLTKADSEKYAGNYSAYGNVSAGDDGSLKLDQYGVVYKPQDDGTYFESQGQSRIRFEEINGKMYMLAIVGSKEIIAAEKVVQTKADSSFDSWIGEYSPTTAYKNSYVFPDFKLHKDAAGYAMFSSMDPKTPSSVSVEKISDNEYYIPGTGRTLGGVIRKYIKDGKTHLHYAGLDYVKK